jgi:X-Pro dipeptidyl-peptidase
MDIGLDQDGDGVNDRVAADIIRPSEPATRHLRIPAIIDASGYYYNQGRGNEHQTKKLDASGKPTLFPLFSTTISYPAGTPSLWSTWPARAVPRDAPTSWDRPSERRRPV